MACPHTRFASLFAAACVVLPPCACATTYCVHDEAEFRTALDEAGQNGQDNTIHLVRGSYHANGHPFDYEPGDTHGLAIAGGFNGDCSSRIRNPALTVLDGDDASQVFVSGSRIGPVAIRYVTVQNGATDGRGGGLSFQTYVGQPGNGNVTVSVDIIRHNSAAFGGGLDAGVVGTGVLRVKNNLFVDNTAEDDGAAEIVANDGTVFITNNTFVHNTATDPDDDFNIGGLYANGSAPAVLSNNILWGNSGKDVRSGAALMLDNDYGSDFNAPPDGSSGNLGVDPQFASATDFHLSPASPLIDAGADAPPDGLADTDLDGHERAYGAHVDMGAYERGDAIFGDGFE